MRKLLFSFVFLITLSFSLTVVAQQFTRMRSVEKGSFPEKLHKAVLDPLTAGTYTIGSGGDFPTIDSAFYKLSNDGIAGAVTLELIDTLYTAPTDTMGFRLIGPIPGAGENSMVTLQPASGKNVVFEGDKRYIITFENVSYFDLNGVSTEGATTLTFYSHYNTLVDRNRAVLFWGNCDHNVIQNLTCIGDDIYRYGDLIVMGAIDNSFIPDSNIIQNNFIKKGGGCILIGGFGVSNRAVGNIIRNNKVGSDVDSLINWGIHAEWCEDCIIENNIVQNLKVTTTYGGDILIPGINCYASYNVIVRNNIVHNIKSSAGYTSTGILLSGWSGEYGNNNQVYNNIIYDINSTSTSMTNRVAGIQTWYQVNPKIYYNTVYLSGKGANKFGSAAFYLSNSCSNVDLRNNILVNTRDESPYPASAVYSIGYGFIPDYNNLYCPVNQYNCLVKIGDTKFNTFTDWQATRKDFHSINEMPDFVSPEDLHINASIPTDLEKRGTPITGIDTDFDGDLRNVNLPDIGADEFNGTSPSGALSTGAYSVGVNGFFPTIQTAFNRLNKAGVSGPVTLELIDNLYVAPADTFGFLLEGPISGVGPDNRLTIKPATNNNVTLQGNWRYVFSLKDINFMTLDGVGIEGPTTLTIHSLYNAQYETNRGVSIISNSDHNVLQNVNIICDDYQRDGIGIFLGTSSNSTSVPDSNLIQNNFIRKAGCGIYISGYYANPNTRPIGNIVRGNKIGSEIDSLISWGIQVEKSQNTIVENNIVQNLKLANSVAWENINLGINSYWGSGDIIRNNIVYNIKSISGYTSTGILLSGWTGGEVGSNNLIYNNMVYDIQSTSTQSNNRVAGIQMWYQQNPKIYYNSVSLYGKGTNHLGSAALYVQSACTNVDVKNNILVNTRDESPYWTAAIYNYGSSGAQDYNDLYTNLNTNSYLVKIGSTNYNTLTDWQAKGEDLHSVNEKPNFTDIHLHINETIPTYLEKGGTPIEGIEVDFDGETRHTTTPDIGADEFNGVVVGVEDEVTLPAEFTLDQNYPNPFNPSTKIKYSVPQTSQVQIKVFDVLGKEIETLVSEEKPAGNYELNWNAVNLSSGVYFYQIKAGDFISTKKMILLK
jgi:hypothetical protein